MYVIGEPGLVNALYDAGMTMNDYNPDYVVFGETRSLSYEKIEHAVRLVQRGAKLIGTNTCLLYTSKPHIAGAGQIFARRFCGFSILPATPQQIWG